MYMMADMYAIPQLQFPQPAVQEHQTRPLGTQVNNALCVNTPYIYIGYVYWERGCVYDVNVLISQLACVVDRAMAFLKRLLITATHSAPHIAAALLLLMSEVIRARAGVSKALSAMDHTGTHSSSRG